MRVAGPMTDPEQAAPAVAATEIAAGELAKPPILPKGASGWLWLAGKIVISLAILAFALSRIDLSRVAEAMSRLSPWAYLLSLAAMMSATLLAALRWSLLTRRLTATISIGEAIELYLAALFVGQALPSTLGMDAVRAWAASRRHKPASEVVGAIMLDRAYGMAGLAVLILLGAPRLLTMGNLAIGESAAIAAGVVILGAVGGIGAVALLLRANVTGPLARVQKVARSMLTALLSPYGAAVAPLSVVVHALLTGSVILIADGLGAPINAADAFATVPAAMLISTIPVSINGWGLREGAMIACLALAGVRADDAFALSILFGIGQFLTALPGAAYWVFARQRSAG
jgi:uncharacterized membrane protein YbhN (UPF0104 family)